MVASELIIKSQVWRHMVASKLTIELRSGRPRCELANRMVACSMRACVPQAELPIRLRMHVTCSVHVFPAYVVCTSQRICVIRSSSSEWAFFVATLRQRPTSEGISRVMGVRKSANERVIVSHPSIDNDLLARFSRKEDLQQGRPACYWLD